MPIKDKNSAATFAIAFGQGRHLLQEGVVEERFGLRVVLNSIGPDSFRSIDKTTLGAVPKHSREQMSREVSPADFGIDIEQDLVSSVTAKTTDPKRFGKIMTGRDAIGLTASVDVTNISEFLSHSLAQSRSTAYRANFDWIDQIAEVRDGITETELNAALEVDRLNARNLPIKPGWQFPRSSTGRLSPAFVTFDPKQAELADDLALDRYLEAASEDQITADGLKNHRIFAISAETEEQELKWSAFRCLYTEIDWKGRLYILNNGKWYEIARDFSEAVQSYFQKIPDSQIDLPDYTGGDELDYNTSNAVQHLGRACCMDQQTVVYGGGRSKIEFCDIFTNDKKLVHVKKYGASSVLSHLFMQGAVSGELFLGDGEFRAKLNQILPRGYKLTDPRRSRPNPSEYEIVYAIISGSANPLNIPFFSKVSFRSARRRLENYGYRVTKKKIQKV